MRSLPMRVDYAGGKAAAGAEKGRAGATLPAAGLKMALQVKHLLRFRSLPPAIILGLARDRAVRLVTKIHPHE